MKKKLSKEDKKTWVDALMSGNYEQSIGLAVRFYGDGHRSHCVMAVGGNELKNDPFYHSFVDDEVRKQLIDMNDTYEIPFEVLAGFIHENL
jgi:hypothetical protein